MKRFAEDEGYGRVADLVEVLWEMGFRSCAALHRVAKHDFSALKRLLGPHTTVARINYLRDFANDFKSEQGFLTFLRIFLLYHSVKQ